MAQGLFLSRASALRVSPAPRCAGQGYRAWRAYPCWVAMDPCSNCRSHPARRLLRRGFQSFFDTVCGARRLVIVQRHGGKLLLCVEGHRPPKSGRRPTSPADEAGRYYGLMNEVVERVAATGRGGVL